MAVIGSGLRLIGADAYHLSSPPARGFRFQAILRHGMVGATFLPSERRCHQDQFPGVDDVVLNINDLRI
jgi:hypothetical protein